MPLTFPHIMRHNTLIVIDRLSLNFAYTLKEALQCMCVCVHALGFSFLVYFHGAGHPSSQNFQC